MTDDLVKRLWLAKLLEQDGRESMLPQQAADRIEALEAQLAAVQFERDGLAGHIAAKFKALYPRRLSDEEMQRLSDTGELP
jgi:hypothetical protein